ncbi:MAG TPA: hypothetical protein PLQ63_00835, partial [Propionicimonas sp.]|nr:hypothetical protein [Propionicimonas sp.]
MLRPPAKPVTESRTPEPPAELSVIVFGSGSLAFPDQVASELPASFVYFTVIDVAAPAANPPTVFSPSPELLTPGSSDVSLRPLESTCHRNLTA